MTANFLLADRVKDTSTSQSSTTITLSGTPPSGFQSFNAGVGDGNYTAYCAFDTSGNWEVGYGVYTNVAKTLGRLATPIASSNAGAQVASFSGTVTVLLGDEAGLFNGDVIFGGAGLPLSREYTSLGIAMVSSSPGALTTTGQIYFVPIFIPQYWSSCTLDVAVTALVSGTSTIDQAIYSSANGAPNTLLGSQTGMNTGTGGATGAQTTSTLTPAAPQPPGLYWHGLIIHTASPTFRTVSGTNSVGVRAILGASSSNDGTNYTGYQLASTSSFPATVTQSSLTVGVGVVSHVAAVKASL